MDPPHWKFTSPKMEEGRGDNQQMEEDNEKDTESKAQYMLSYKDSYKIEEEEEMDEQPIDSADDEQQSQAEFDEDEEQEEEDDEDEEEQEEEESDQEDEDSEEWPLRKDPSEVIEISDSEEGEPLPHFAKKIKERKYLDPEEEEEEDEEEEIPEERDDQSSTSVDSMDGEEPWYRFSKDGEQQPNLFSDERKDSETQQNKEELESNIEAKNQHPYQGKEEKKSQSVFDHISQKKKKFCKRTTTMVQRTPWKKK